MKLLEWMKQNERSAAWIARHCDVSPAAVAGWLEGKWYPGCEALAKIQALTSGAVTPADFVKADQSVSFSKEG